MSKKAMITGITGQDGSYLAELLLAKGYEVHGIIRRSSTFNTGRIAHIFQDPHEVDQRLFLYYGDLASGEQVSNIVQNIRPNEIYHLAAPEPRPGEFRNAGVHERDWRIGHNADPRGYSAFRNRDALLQRGQFGDVRGCAGATE